MAFCSNKTHRVTDELAESRIDLLHQKCAQATAAINHTANHLFVPETVFRENNQVWLESKHLALPHQSKKLVPKQVGPCHCQDGSPVEACSVSL